MTPEQVIALCHKYEEELGKLASPERLSAASAGPNDAEAIAHVLWMCAQTRSYATLNMEKACRWLGFVQGVLWMTGMRNIDEMREENG